MTFPQRLQAWLAFRAMSRSALAKTCGVSRVAVGHWLRGANHPAPKTLDERILPALALTHAEFYGPIPAPAPAASARAS